MCLRSTAPYPCQAWTVAAIAMLACAVSLGAAAVGLWLLIYTENFVSIIGVSMRNVFAGYSSLGGFMGICGMFGTCASISRNKHALVSGDPLSSESLSILTQFTVLMLANFVCLGSVWVFIFLERRKVSSKLLENITYHPQYNSFLSDEFSNCTLTGGDTHDALVACRDSIDEWLTRVVWALLGVAAALLVFQLLLLVTSAMLRQMVYDYQSRNHVNLIHVQPSSEGDKDFNQEAWLREVFSPADPTPPSHGNLPHHTHNEPVKHTHMHRTFISF